MTGLDTAGPRVRKTIREKTSLLPRSCALLGHLPALGVSPTCQPPATGNGSVTLISSLTPAAPVDTTARGLRAAAKSALPGLTCGDGEPAPASRAPVPPRCPHL